MEIIEIKWDLIRNKWKLWQNNIKNSDYKHDNKLTNSTVNNNSNLSQSSSDRIPYSGSNNYLTMLTGIVIAITVMLFVRIKLLNRKIALQSEELKNEIQDDENKE